jgi:YidC/Oxa1 family membrane protein insertase
VFTFLFYSVPSGLVLYWFVNNLLSIGQRYIVQRQIAGEDAARAAADDGNKG